MEKILPVKKPPITAYMTHTPILSVILDNKECLPWFFLNYIQMRVHDDGIDFYNFYTAHYSCPFFDTTYLSRQFLSTYIANKKITDFFMRCIDDNYYIVALIDTSFIKLYSSSNRGNAHPIFIYGYDQDKKGFYAADFFTRGVFSFKNTSFNELELAYQNCDESNHWQKGVHLLKRIDYTKRYTMSLIIDSLKKYLYGYETSIGYNQNTDENAVFGLNASYNRVLKEIQNFKSFQPYDNRLFPIFCEHKIVLKMLSEFLSNNGCVQISELQQEYDYLYEKSFILRNKWLKYRRQNINNLYDENELFALEELEINLLKRTINILENMSENIYF